MTLLISVDLSEPRMIDFVTTDEKKRKAEFINRAKSDKSASPTRTLHIISVEREGITHSPLEDS